MKKVQILQKVSEVGVVAVIRGNTPEEALEMSRACIAGGVSIIEVTFTTPQADYVIRTLSEEYKENTSVVIGAGTVLEEVTARIAILAGADFIVSPSLDAETAKICNLYQVPYHPGCMTVTEVKEALKLGVDVVKLFPGSAFGPDFIKNIKGPLPDVSIMPSGGVSLDNVHEWIGNGCVAVSVGGNLVNAARGNGDYQNVTDLAKQYIEKVKSARAK